MLQTFYWCVTVMLPMCYCRVFVQKKSMKKASVVKPAPVEVSNQSSDEEGDQGWEQGGGCLYGMEDCGRCDYCKVHHSHPDIANYNILVI